MAQTVTKSLQKLTAVKAAVLHEYFFKDYAVELDIEYDSLYNRISDSHRDMNELIIAKEEIHNKLSNLKSNASLDWM